MVEAFNGMDIKLLIVEIGNNEAEGTITGDLFNRIVGEMSALSGLEQLACAD